MKKGEAGNLKYRCRREYIITVVLFAISFGILLTGLIINGSKYNVLTVAAVLGMLPAVRFLTSSIVFSKAEKFSCSSKIVESLKDRKDVLFDLYLTGYDKSFPVGAAVVSDKGAVIFLNDNKSDAKLAEEHVMKQMKQAGLSDMSIKFFKEEDKFLRAAEHHEDHNEGGRCAELMNLLLDISL